MYYSIKSTSDRKSFIVSESTYQTSHKPSLDTPPNKNKSKQKRTQSEFGSPSYQRSLRRAFARAKLLAYFNPDLNQFITFTYKGTDHTPQQVIQHIKDLVKTHNKKNTKRDSLPFEIPAVPRFIDSAWQKPGDTIGRIGNRKTEKKQTQQTKQLTIDPHTFRPIESQGESEQKSEGQGDEWKPLKYIYVMEYQKRGSIHVHMIANNALELFKNKNGHMSVKNWSHGFTSVLTMSDVDNNFKPYLYLFKYMTKAERIGASFIHVSRNFDKIESLDYAAYIDKLSEDNILFEEDFDFYIEQTAHRIVKKYYKLV